MNNLDVCLEVV